MQFPYQRDMIRDKHDMIKYCCVDDDGRDGFKIKWSLQNKKFCLTDTFWVESHYESWQLSQFLSNKHKQYILILNNKKDMQLTRKRVTKTEHNGTEYDVYAKNQLSKIPTCLVLSHRL